MKILFIIFFILTFASLKAGEIDSLELLLPKAKGIEKANIMNRIAASYREIAPELRLSYARQALTIAKEHNIDSVSAKSLFNIGLGYYYLSKLDSSVHYFDLSLKIYEKLRDTFHISSCLNNLGVLSSQRNRYVSTINYYSQALKIKEGIKDSSGIAKVLNNIANVYYEWKKIDEAIDFFNKALFIRQKIKDSLQLGMNYRNLGSCYLDKSFHYFDDKTRSPDYYILYPDKIIKNDSTKKYIELAASYLNRAFEIYKNKKSPTGLAAINVLLSLIKYYNGDYAKAEKMMKGAVDSLANSGDKLSLARALYYLGSMNLFLKDNNSARENIGNAVQIAEENGFLNILNSGYESLMNIYKIDKNYRRAQEFAEKLLSVRDSIFNTENISTVEEFEHKYQITKKDAELIIALEKEQRLRLQLIIMAISAFLLLSILIAFYIRYRYKNKLAIAFKEKNEELTMLNTQLEESRIELKQVNISKDRFISIIAHDLRSPVGAFRDATEFINNNYDELNSEEKREFIFHMKNSSALVFNLLDNLLTWTRSQTGKIEFEPEDVRFDYIKSRSLDVLAMNADKKNIKIINNIPDDIYIYSDFNMFSTVLRNLVSNAIKFTKPGGNIILEINDENENICLIIRDDGIGMDDKVKDSLFRIGESVSRRGTSDENGTGLGLILCKEFIDRHRGTLTFESEPGKGTTFYIKLPKRTQIPKE